MSSVVVIGAELSVERKEPVLSSAPFYTTGYHKSHCALFLKELFPLFGVLP